MNAQSERRDARRESTWRIFRLTSMIATGVLLVVLVAIDVTYQFASWQLNVVIALVALCMLVLLKLDYWLHQLLRQVRRRTPER